MVRRGGGVRCNIRKGGEREGAISGGGKMKRLKKGERGKYRVTNVGGGRANREGEGGVG